MLATLAGLLALVAGLLLLLLPLLTPELSRQRDAVWGAVVLLLGLTLVTSSERLVGAPMLAVLCGTLLIGRLSVEVGQGRWRALSPQEQQALGTSARWQTGLQQLLAAGARLLALTLELRQLLLDRLGRARAARSSGKRWIRPDADAPAAEPTVVTSLTQVDALIAALPEAEPNGETG